MASSAASVRSITLTDGRSLCARRWRGSGRHTVVFLHGLLDSSEGWTHLCERMDCGRIAFDLPGFGHSDAPPEGSIAGYARDVAEGIEALGLKRFTLVGHSLGGAVAASLAELMPTRVGALVLLAPAGFGRIHLAEAISIPGVRNVVHAALPFALTSSLAVTAGYMAMVTNGVTPERRLVHRVTSSGKDLVHGAREGTRAVVEAGRSRTAFHRRQMAYDGPVFAVWGEQDRLVPTSHRRGVRIAFPHAEIELWPGMGHHPARERFADLLGLVVRAAAAGRAPTAGKAATAATGQAAHGAPAARAA